MHHAHHRGFTLIELSIVLVIIGLIAGGVLVGKDLIKASEMRQLVSQYENFNTAVNTFKLKYNCLPGDCKDAYDFFGSTLGCSDGPIGTGNGGSLLNDNCNGDGDKFINHSREQWRAWQQLEAAELINENIDMYTSLATVLTSIPEDALPVGIIPTGPRNIVWYLFFTNTVSVHEDINSYTSHVFKLNRALNRGGCCSFLQITGFAYRAGAINALEAESIDKKIDDGVRAAGKIRGGRSTLPQGGWDWCRYGVGETTNELSYCGMHMLGSF